MCVEVGGVRGWSLDSMGFRVLTDLVGWGARRALLRTGDPGGQGGLVVGEGEHDSLDEGVGEDVIVGVGEHLGKEVIVGGTGVVDGMHVGAVCSGLDFDRFIGKSCVNVVGVGAALVWGGERWCLGWGVSLIALGGSLAVEGSTMGMVLWWASLSKGVEV